MKIAKLTPFLAVSPQIAEADLGALAAQGFRTVINNRPDSEAEDQPASATLAAAAERVGLDYRHVPAISGKITDDDVAAFAEALDQVKGPVLAFCRTGTRSTTLWALAEARHLDPAVILTTAAEAGYDLAALKPRLDVRWRTAELAGSPARVVEFTPAETHDVVIVGGGSAGIATASSLLRRRPSLKIAVIEPRERHYYQPGWTLVGGGVFDRALTERSMASVMPKGVRWIRGAVAAFEPERNRVVLEDGTRIAYRTLVAAPGIELHWAGVEGLQETLGKNGVTSNYLFEMAPYTWELGDDRRRPAADRLSRSAGSPPPRAARSGARQPDA
jgi:sulfide:quinone oxidoreductase